MHIVWLGCRNAAAHRAFAGAIAAHERVASIEEISLDAPAERIENGIAAADGAVLAVHHFEPRTSRWFDRLGSLLDSKRWRAALGPFALVAGRAPFDVLHRQGIAADDLRSARRWLDSLTPEEARVATPGPGSVLLWAPSEERCGVDPDALARRCKAKDERPDRIALLTPRTSGLPFHPDVVIAWIPADLDREERVHLGQLQAAAPTAARIAVYASPSAKARVPFSADEAFVWPCDAGALSEAAAELVAARALGASADRAA